MNYDVIAGFCRLTPRNGVESFQRNLLTLSSKCKSKPCEKLRYVNFTTDGLLEVHRGPVADCCPYSQNSFLTLCSAPFFLRCLPRNEELLVRVSPITRCLIQEVQYAQSLWDPLTSKKFIYDRVPLDVLRPKCSGNAVDIFRRSRVQILSWSWVGVFWVTVGKCCFLPNSYHYHSSLILYYINYIAK